MSKIYFEINGEEFEAEKIEEEQRGQHVENKVWYKITIDGEERRVLFKPGYTIGEVVAYKTSQVLGIKCCRAERAILHDSQTGKMTDGCISFCELDKDEELIGITVLLEKYFEGTVELSEYERTGVVSFDTAIELIKRKTKDDIENYYRNSNISPAELAEEVGRGQKRNIKNFLEMIIGLDIPCVNGDRHLENWGMAVGGENIIRFYNCFDNEAILGLFWEDIGIVGTAPEEIKSFLESDNSSKISTPDISRINSQLGENEMLVRCSHIELLSYLLLKSDYREETYEIMKNFLNKFKSPQDLLAVLEECGMNDKPYRDYFEFSKALFEYTYPIIQNLMREYERNIGIS